MAVIQEQMLKQLKSYIAVILLMLVSSYALSVVEVKEFSSDQLRDRFQVLVTELRCPKCQNQNLADSNSPISSDLRNEIFRMLEEGKSDQEIIDFLVVRYGEFVMYRPPVKETTLVLWLTPGILVLIGIIIIIVIRRRQAAAFNVNSTNTSSTLVGNEQEQLDQLLGGATKSKQNSEELGSEIESGEEKT